MQTETKVNVNPAPVATEKKFVGRPRTRSFLYLADENGKPQMQDGKPIRASRGKPHSKKHYVWMRPGNDGSYTITEPPVKKEKQAEIKNEQETIAGTSQVADNG